MIAFIGVYRRKMNINIKKVTLKMVGAFCILGWYQYNHKYIQYNVFFWIFIKPQKNIKRTKGSENWMTTAMNNVTYVRNYIQWIFQQYGKCHNLLYHKL